MINLTITISFVRTLNFFIYLELLNDQVSVVSWLNSLHLLGHLFLASEDNKLNTSADIVSDLFSNNKLCTRPLQSRWVIGWLMIIVDLCIIGATSRSAFTQARSTFSYFYHHTQLISALSLWQSCRYFFLGGLGLIYSRYHLFYCLSSLNTQCLQKKDIHQQENKTDDSIQ